MAVGNIGNAMYENGTPIVARPHLSQTVGIDKIYVHGKQPRVTVHQAPNGNQGDAKPLEKSAFHPYPHLFSFGSSEAEIVCRLSTGLWFFQKATHLRNCGQYKVRTTAIFSS